MAVAGGPLLAPIVASAMLVSNVSWQWTEYVSTAEAGKCFSVLTICSAR